MRAVLCSQFGPIDNIAVGEIAAPTPQEGEVLVAVEAASVQFVDIRVIEGKSLLNTTKLDEHFGRKVKVGLPLVPGTEAAGTVVAVGPGVSGFAPGDRVLGTSLMGAWAEQAVFQQHEICRIPKEMSFDDAAAFYVLYFTAAYSLFTRGSLTSDDTVLVLGAGSGVGLAIIEVAKAVGARVVAAASTEEKLSAAKSRGADALVNYGATNLDLTQQKILSSEFKKAAGKAGISVIADLVGGQYAEPAMRAMNFKGRFLSIGFSAGVPAIPMHVIFNKNGSIIGVEPVADKRLPGDIPELMQRLFGWYREGKLKPMIGGKYPLAQAVTALKLLEQRKAVGRILLDVRS
ncbi:MAG: NADPH:quinone oxidoreductase family protein [Steroidobacteraceae bacterium]